MLIYYGLGAAIVSLGNQLIVIESFHGIANLLLFVGCTDLVSLSYASCVLENFGFVRVA